MTAPAISVLVVTRRRYDALDELLAGLTAQEDAPSFELLVASHADDGVAPVVQRRFPAALVLPVDGVFPGGARNHLIERATGDILLFLDDDVTVRADLLARTWADASAYPDCDVFGGPNLTPLGSSIFEVVQGAVLASLVGSGPVRHRYGAHPPGPADERFFTLCNLAIRRRAMVPFDPELLCAEENDVLAELHRRHSLMHYDPTMVVFHARRSTLGGFGRQMFKYGRGRGQLLRRRPTASSLPHLLPALLLVYVVAIPALGATVGWWTLTGLGVYLAAVAAGAAKVAITMKRPTAGPLAAVLIPVLHGCYGGGVAWGVLRGKVPARPKLLSPLKSEPEVGAAT